ncbi:MAG: hypothetical protein K2P77_05895 [Burkholderiaceae bacterium]|nr:hypothetical protein [Burkholderiaceae bacterium]
MANPASLYWTALFSGLRQLRTRCLPLEHHTEPAATNKDVTMTVKFPLLLSIYLFGTTLNATATTAANTAAPGVAAAYRAAMLTPQAASADIALLRRALETIHPGLHRYRSKDEIDAAFARLQTVTQQPLSELELWQAVALMLAEIHCDHTKPEPSAALSRYRREHPTHLPLRFRLVEGRMIVTANDGQAGAPTVGSEITAINGRPVPQVLATLGRAVAYDGDTSHAIDAKLAADGDLDGDDLNEYWPAFYGFAQQWKLGWKTAGAAGITQSTLSPITLERWATLPAPGAAWRAEFDKDVRWRITGKQAYLRIDSFVNYRHPVDADAFLGKYFKAMRAAGTTDLIVDLRENGGGSDDAALALARYLLPQPFTWLQPQLLKTIRYGDLPDYIESWGDRQALFAPPASDFVQQADGWWRRLPRPGNPDDASVLPQQPAADGYRGRLTLLTSARNGSGATLTIALLKAQAAARLVGEDTGGSAEGPTAGTIFLLTLPNSGLKVRIPSKWNRSSVPHFTPRRGVAVNVQVTPTYADLLRARDTVLEVAQSMPAAVATTQFHAALTGQWRGTLDYRDYGNDQRVILPASASVTGNAGALQASFSYDDGPGKTVRSTQTWQLDASGQQLRIDGNEQPQVVVESRAGPGLDLILATQQDGEDNGQSVQVRTVLTRRGDTITLSRLTRLPGQPWLMRHAYHLDREN